MENLDNKIANLIEYMKFNKDIIHPENCGP